MRNRLVLEGAQNVNQRVHLAKVGEKRRLLERLLPNGGYVDILDRRKGGLLRRVQRGKLLQPLIGHPRNADVGLARIGAPMLLDMRLGEDFE